jgi:hypothetical protein
MTYGPPPGNPPGQPGGYGPPPQGGQPGGYGQPPQGGYGQPGQYGPPQGQYGPPPGQYGASKPAFDPKNVNPLDWGILGAGFLAFIFSFIAFYDGADVESGGRTATVDTGTYSAWHDVVGGGFFSWFAMLFAILGAVAVAMALLASQVKLPVPNRLVGLALFAAAAVFEIVGIFVTPGDSGSTGFGSNIDVSLNHGFGFWASLIFILAGTVLSLMRLQQTGGKLPGALGNLPNIGAKGPQSGYAAGYGQPQGYGAPPAQGPPPGYQQQYQQPPPGYQQQYQQPPPGYQQQAPQQQPPPPPQPPPGYQPQPPPGGYQPPPPGYQAPPPGYQAPPPGYQAPPPQQGDQQQS